MLTQPHGIGARFNQRDQASLVTSCTQPLQGACYSRRVMGEVVVYRHPRNSAQQFQATFDTLKDRQCFCRHGCWHANMKRCRHCRQRILHIVQTAVRPLYLDGFRFRAIDLEMRAIRADQFAVPICRSRVSKAASCAPAAHFHHLIDGGHPLGVDYLPITRHTAYKMVKLSLNRSQVVKDISVVKFQVVYA